MRTSFGIVSVVALAVACGGTVRGVGADDGDGGGSSTGRSPERCRNDVDCGGLFCPHCPPSASCELPGDCETVCLDQICQPPTCHDGMRDGSESDYDCGGPDCPPCVAGMACSIPDDCASGDCAGGTCGPSHCFDGFRNGGEPNVDCGGPCRPCGPGSTCLLGRDCESGVCDGGVCAFAVPGFL